jgi:hypothetical protein
MVGPGLSAHQVETLSLSNVRSRPVRIMGSQPCLPSPVACHLQPVPCPLNRPRPAPRSTDLLLDRSTNR